VYGLWTTALRAIIGSAFLEFVSRLFCWFCELSTEVIEFCFRSSFEEVYRHCTEKLENFSVSSPSSPTDKLFVDREEELQIGVQLVSTSLISQPIM
jgi:hypothetical protein